MPSHWNPVTGGLQRLPPPVDGPPPPRSAGQRQQPPPVPAPRPRSPRNGNKAKERGAGQPIRACECPRNCDPAGGQRQPCRGAAERDSGRCAWCRKHCVGGGGGEQSPAKQAGKEQKQQKQQKQQQQQQQQQPAADQRGMKPERQPDKNPARDRPWTKVDRRQKKT